MSKNFEDISSQSVPTGFREKVKHFGGKIKTFFLRNRKRNLKAFLSVIICLVLIVAAMGGAYIRKMLSLINYNDGIFGNPDATFAYEEEENLNYATMSDISNAEDIKDLLKSWAKNGGEKLHSKNVINVLLIGEDDDDGSHRSDSMILASVNRKAKTITLCSFLRDSYTYMEINGQDRYDKTNHSYGWAGASKVMEVLSDNYKIQIDHFVSIDFKSFEKVIDLLGGVTVPITEAEANYMNRTTTVGGFESGDNVLLNGRRALIYSRIRKLDSEVERTRRQRNVISSVVKNAKASSVSDLNNAVETFLPYVTTNYRSSEILALGSQAISEGWFNYTVTGMVEPAEELCEGVNGFRTYSGYLFVWIVDYVKAAKELQLALYGTTNIEIGIDHISAVDMLRNNYSGSDNYSNNNYDDDDVYEDTTRNRWPDITLPSRGESSSRIRNFFTRPGSGNDEPGENEDNDYNGQTEYSTYSREYTTEAQQPAEPEEDFYNDVTTEYYEEE